MDFCPIGADVRQENPIGHPKPWPGSFPLQDSYLLEEREEFCVERRAAEEDFAEDGEKDFDDLLRAGMGIRWW